MSIRNRLESGVGDATRCSSGELAFPVTDGDSLPMPIRLLLLGALEPSAEVIFRVAGGRPVVGFLFLLKRKAIAARA
jgi:hypothetical protein